MIATVTSVLLAIAGLYIFYGVVIRIAPSSLFPMTDQWLPRGFEWLMIGALCIAGGDRGVRRGNARARIVRRWSRWRGRPADREWQS